MKSKLAQTWTEYVSGEEHDIIALQDLEECSSSFPIVHSMTKSMVQTKTQSIFKPLSVRAHSAKHAFQHTTSCADITSSINDSLFSSNASFKSTSNPFDLEFCPPESAAHMLSNKTSFTSSKVEGVKSDVIDVGASRELTHFDIAIKGGLAYSKTRMDYIGIEDCPYIIDHALQEHSQGSFSNSLFFDPSDSDMCPSKANSKMIGILNFEMDLSKDAVETCLDTLCKEQANLRSKISVMDYVFYYVFGHDRSGYFTTTEKLQVIKDHPWTVFEQDIWKDGSASEESLNHSMTSLLKETWVEEDAEAIVVGLDSTGHNSQQDRQENSSVLAPGKISKLVFEQV